MIDYKKCEKCKCNTCHELRCSGCNTCIINKQNMRTMNGCVDYKEKKHETCNKS